VLRKRITPLSATAFVAGMLAYWAPLSQSATRGNYGLIGMAIALVLLGACAGIRTRKGTLLGPGGLGFWTGWVGSLVLSLAIPGVLENRYQLPWLEYGAMILAWFLFAALGPGLIAGVLWKLFVVATFAPPTTLLGSLFGSAYSNAIQGVSGDRHRRNVAWATLGAALLVIALTPALIHVQIREYEANGREKTIALVRAQFAYRAAHPEAGFSCRLSDLGVPFASETRWRWRDPDVDHDDAWEDDYTFRLWCRQSTTPRDQFAIETFPQNVGFGSARFCADESGVVRAIVQRKKGEGGKCWHAGEVVATVPVN
jgi:xanthosine utilization system XapX-like protein